MMPRAKSVAALAALSLLANFALAAATTCPSYADCVLGETAAWATQASVSPGPKDATAASLLALLGPPNWSSGSKCLSAPPTTYSQQLLAWSYFSGNTGGIGPPKTALTVTFSTALFPTQLAVRVVGSQAGSVLSSPDLELASGGSIKVR